MLTRQPTTAVATAWGAVLASLTLPSAILPVPGWIDGSWQVGLELAVRGGLPLGARPIWTYGPLGFLDIRQPYFAEQWLIGVATTMLIHALLVASIGVLLYRRRLPLIVWVAAALPLLIALADVRDIVYEGPIAALILCYLAVDFAVSGRAHLAAAAAGVLLTVLALMSGTDLFITAGLIAVTVVHLSLRHRAATIAVLLGSCAVSAAFIWWHAGLGLDDIAPYLRGAIELGSGYGAAMYVGGLNAHTVAAVLVLAAVAASAVASASGRRAALSGWFFGVFVVEFLFFKDAFVRWGPDRDQIFFSTVAVALVVTAILVSRPVLHARRWMAVVPAALAVTVLIGVAQTTDGGHPLTLDSLDQRWSGYRTAIHAALDAAARHQLQDRLIKDARTNYRALIADLSLPRTATIDMLTVDTGLFYAEPSLRWDPRPVLQSYQANTSWLDQQDAAFFSGPSAPDYVVYRAVTIDDRYAPFDEPATLRSLLTHYHEVRVLDPATVLLHRLPSTAVPSVEPVGETCATLGRAIPIPQLSQHWVFASVSIHPTLLGTLAGVALRPPGVRITLRSGPDSSDYRLITGDAADGLYVTSMLGSADSIASAFAGQPGVPITSVTITAAAPWAWAPQVCIDFSTVTPIASGTATRT